MPIKQIKVHELISEIAQQEAQPKPRLKHVPSGMKPKRIVIVEPEAPKIVHSDTEEWQTGNVRHALARMLSQRPSVAEAGDRGYNTSGEPLAGSDGEDLYGQVMQDHLIRKGCWKPARFKRYPRFTIFTQRDKGDDKKPQKYISLNHQVIMLLAAYEAEQERAAAEGGEEQLVTSASRALAYGSQRGGAGPEGLERLTTEKHAAAGRAPTAKDGEETGSNGFGNGAHSPGEASARLELGEKSLQGFH